MKLRKTKKGFTIVELVIVIGVIGILAGILIPTFVNVTQKADDAALKSNLANAYSSYVADAADGVIDKDHVKAVTGQDYVSTKTYTIELVKQEEIVLVGNGKQYQFDEGAWKEKAFEITVGKNEIAKIDSDWVDATYGGFKVYTNKTRS